MTRTRLIMEEIDEREVSNRFILESEYIDYFTKDVVIDTIYDFLLICGYCPKKEDVADVIDDKENE